MTPSPPDDRAPEMREAQMYMEISRVMDGDTFVGVEFVINGSAYHRGIDGPARIGMFPVKSLYDDYRREFIVRILPELPMGGLGAALDAAHNDKIESVALVKAEAAVNWSIASYALEQWEEWVDSELDGTANYADTKAEIANLRASLGMGREGGEEKG